MNNNWLGRSNSALYALALIGVWKFAGLLHAVLPRRITKSACLGA
ncbi:Uncharacterised protein [Cedecea neteri]|uniref:Uncharacterized protein n=1 Tax=Cedecea neteri TaxID=158822 RepID=A0A2X3JFG2_9ENTR|nr:Uncharacterised protein [Cedecea neteri]